MVREKVDYHRYMASREWALKKKAVRELAQNICERCASAPIQNIHHLTYATLGHEEPENDLQGLCRPCHEYVSAEREIDPAEIIMRALINNHGLTPFIVKYGSEAGQLQWFDSGVTDSRSLAVRLGPTPEKTNKWFPVCFQLVPGVWATCWCI